MAEYAVGQMVVVRLGDGEYAGEVTLVSPDRVEVTVRLRHDPPASVPQGGGTITFGDGRQQPFSPSSLSLFTTLVIALSTDETQMPISEKRRFLRIDRRVPVHVRQGEGEESRLIASGATRDLSGGGTQLELEAPLEVGALFQLTLFLPDESVQIPARVLRTTRQRGGSYWISMAFEGLTEAERSRIIRYIFARLRSLKGGATTGIDRQRFQLPPSKIRYW